MTAAARARYKLKLQQIRAEILAEGDLAIEPTRKDASDIGGDEDEQPLAEMNQAIASKRNHTRTDILARVNRAMTRMVADPDMFGTCSECEEPIGKRLELLPYVELCTECQQARDGSPRLGRRKNLHDFKLK